MFWAAQRAASVPRALRRLTRAYSSESSEPAVATELIPPVAPVKPTHGVHVATLQLKSYNQKTFDLDFFADFALRCAQALEIPTGGIASLPTRTSLWTVPRGPFVHKKSQENFWRRTHRRSIKVYDASDATVDRWLQFLRMHEMPGVASKVSLFRYVAPHTHPAAIPLASASSSTPRRSSTSAASRRCARWPKRSCVRT